MKKLVNIYVWVMVGLMYAVLGAKCVMMWDDGRGAAALGAKLPHYLALPLLLTAGVALANWFESGIIVDSDGTPQLRRVLMLTLALFIYIEGILLFIPFNAETRIRFLHLLLSGIGVFLIVLGLLMPHLKRNRVAGVRYSWTMTDPEVWRESNRVGGRYTVAMGILLGVSQFFPQRRDMFFSTVELWAFVIYVVALTLHSRLIALRKNPPKEQ